MKRVFFVLAITLILTVPVSAAAPIAPPRTSAADGPVYPTIQQLFLETGAAAFRTPDVNRDGQVDILDFSWLATFFGQTVPPAPEKVDFHDNKMVDRTDFLVLCSVYGGPAPDLNGDGWIDRTEVGLPALVTAMAKFFVGFSDQDFWMVGVLVPANSKILGVTQMSPVEKGSKLFGANLPFWGDNNGPTFAITGWFGSDGKFNPVGIITKSGEFHQPLVKAAGGWTGADVFISEQTVDKIKK